MGVTIHPTAILDPTAHIGENVSVGPFTIIESRAVIGDGCHIAGHAVIGSHTSLGKSCRIFPGAIVGTIPQDLKYNDEQTTLVIGDNAIIREYCTINRGTRARGATTIGNNCALLAYSHVGHDCSLGDFVVASNNLTLAGHLEIGNHVGFGGLVAVHQFCRIGDYAYIGGTSGITLDVLPFALIGPKNGDVRIAGINKIGLERNGFDSDRRMKIKRAFKLLFMQELTITDACQRLIELFPQDQDILLIVNFIKNSKRGIHRMSSVCSDDE